uniref:G protein pathway suppressor 2 n=1 Tax=Anopheles atroparvus TaxID=41427 RepID=A0AAG5D3H7_ANOAO
MSAKKYLKMPAQQPTQPAAKTEKEEHLWNALKRHIMRERERKKQELEAEVEEERLRREREEREKQDVMTLGETKEQILILEKNLDELRNEKQQLFLQLKKVLNEDDNRKRQLKEEMFAIQNIPQQIFLPQRSMPPHQHQPHSIHKVNQPEVIISSERKFNDAYPHLQGNLQVNVAKRTHSPSSPQHIQGYYKQPNLNSQPYHTPQKIEEGRRGGEVPRAVLWNKSQYCAPVGYYPATIQSVPQDGRQPQPQILYPYQSNLTLPIRQYIDLSGQPGPLVQSKPEHMMSSAVLHGHPPGPPPQLKTITIEKLPQERMVPYHIELAKHDDRKDLRASHIPPPPQQVGVVATHLPEGIVYTPHGLRPGAIQMHAIATNQQLPKNGSITQGYPSARPPMMSNPQQPPPSQMHYNRQRY